MPRPQNKIDLLTLAEKNYDEFVKFIASMSDAEKNTPFDFSSLNKKEAHWSRDKNTRDVICHLVEWHKLLLKFVAENTKNRSGGNYIFTEEEKDAFVKKEPRAEKYFKKWLGSDEFINRYSRWCLWLGDATPAELVKIPLVMERVKAVREFRLKSKSAPTQRLAEKPTHFHVENMPKSEYILIPRVSSEKRSYIPIGFITPDILCSDSVHILNCSKSKLAPIFVFGILTSSVHMAWTRAVCGRLEMRYRYSKDIVYNNFPFVTPECHTDSELLRNSRNQEKSTETPSGVSNPCDNLPHCTQAQAEKIEASAQAILDARAKYPELSLAELYGENMFMFPELEKAHKENDRTVLQAYGFPQDATESEIVARLFGLYSRLTQEK